MLSSQRLWSIGVAAATLSTLTLGAIESAHALSITKSSGPISGASLIDFENVPTGQIPTTPNSLGVGNGGEVDLYQSVTPPNLLSGARVLPLATGPDNFLAVRSATATFRFPDRLVYLGFLWKSINDSNTINFYQGNASLFSYTGAQIKGLLNIGNLQSAYVNFFANDLSERFDRVEIADPQDLAAFQIDNVAYKVPTPALLPGLIGLGLGVLRKRKQVAKSTV